MLSPKSATSICLALLLYGGVAYADVDPPKISPEGAGYGEPQEVTISAEDSDQIRYTLFGDEPNEHYGRLIDSSTGQFTLNHSATVKAVAIKDGEVSDVADETFDIIPDFDSGGDDKTFVGVPGDDYDFGTGYRDLPILATRTEEEAKENSKKGVWTARFDGPFEDGTINFDYKVENPEDSDDTGHRLSVIIDGDEEVLHETGSRHSPPDHSESFESFSYDMEVSEREAEWIEIRHENTSTYRDNGHVRAEIRNLSLPEPYQPQIEAEVSMDPSGGDYDDSTEVLFDVNTTHPDWGDEDLDDIAVMYTDDGWDPILAREDEDLEAHFASPGDKLQLDSDTTLRAIAIRDGYLPSKPDIQDYYVPYSGDEAQEELVKPDIRLEGAGYGEPQDITISTETNDAQIRYTLFGHEPTKNYGRLIDGQTGTFNLPHSAVVKAVAIKDGEVSDVADETFDIIPDFDSGGDDKTFVGVPGDDYDFGTGYRDLPILATRTEEEAKENSKKGVWTARFDGPFEDGTINFDYKVENPEDSDDTGHRLSVIIDGDEEVLHETGSRHSPPDHSESFESFSYDMEVSEREAEWIEIRHENTSTYRDNGHVRAEIRNLSLPEPYQPELDAEVNIDPPGGDYDEVTDAEFNIDLNDPDWDAEDKRDTAVIFTTDGTTPSFDDEPLFASDGYTQQVAGDMLIRAKAVRDGWRPSAAVAREDYSVDYSPRLPQISPDGVSYFEEGEEATVSIEPDGFDAQHGAELYYSTDGTDPLSDGQSAADDFPVELTIEEDTTIRAAVSHDDWGDSGTAVANIEFYDELLLDVEGVQRESYKAPVEESVEISARGGDTDSDYSLEIAETPDRRSPSPELSRDTDSRWDVTVPRSGAFAGEYEIRVQDDTTGWEDVAVISVPLEIGFTRTSILGKEGVNNSSTAALIAGGVPGDTFDIEVRLDAGGNGDEFLEYSDAVEATNMEQRGNPAEFDIEYVGEEEADENKDLVVEVTRSSDGLQQESSDLQVVSPLQLQGSLLDEEEDEAIEGAVARFEGESVWSDSTDDAGNFQLWVPQEASGNITVGATGYDEEGVSISICKDEDGCTVDLSPVEGAPFAASLEEGSHIFRDAEADEKIARYSGDAHIWFEPEGDGFEANVTDRVALTVSRDGLEVKSDDSYTLFPLGTHVEELLGEEHSEGARATIDRTLEFERQ
nr:chitobiase/beta-hexosaminidase C-terminal domain-containing protein [Halorhodospira halochloris]